MKRAVLLLLVALVAAESAQAAVVRRTTRRARLARVAEPAPTFGLVLRGGLSTYAMEDMNDFFFASNVTIGTELEEVDGGGSFGGGVRLWPGPEVMVELAYERLTGTSEDFGGTGEVGLDANLAMVSFTYAPQAYRAARFGLGAGLGFVSSDAEVRGPGGRGSIEGSGPAFHFFGLLESPLGDNAAFTADAGYRYAVASDVDIVGIPSNIDVDWSGLVLRGGLAVYFR
jgi:opacity protein-like surface antigen